MKIPWCRDSGAYQDSGTLSLEDQLRDLMGDLRFALRIFRQKPGLFLAAVVTLALGVGANVAVFSAVRAVLIDQQPYPDPTRLVSLWKTVPRAMPQWFLVPDFEAIQAQTPAFQKVAGCRVGFSTARGEADPDQLVTAEVTRDFFAVFGTAPLVGRIFGADDFEAGARLAVISSSVWQAHFGGAPDVVGKTLRLNREPWTVVGVMPPSFAPACLRGLDSAGVWVPRPLTPADRQPPAGSAPIFLKTFARLAPGATVPVARAQLNAVMAQRRVEFPGDYGADLETYGDTDAAAVRPGLLLLQGVAGFLLLIACANLANLFLAQATARRREFGVRAALGADRRRLVRQLVTEASVIAIAGGALGVVVAYVLLPVFVSTGASALPSTTVVALRVPELLVGLGLGWLTSLIFGVAPAVVASRVDVLDALRGSTQVTANRTVRAMRGALVAVEVLLAVVVLAGAGLLIRSFAHVVSMPLGYDAHGVISADVPLVRPEDHAKENVSLLIDQMTAELRTALGPVPLAFADSMPFGSLLSNEFTLSSSAGEPQTAKPRWSELHIVSPSYFETLRMPLIRGRLFAQNGEDDAAGVAVVSEEFVRQFAAGRDVIGSIVSTPHARDFTIIGVVGDVRTGSLTITPGAAIYQPIGGRAMSQVAVALRAPDRDANRVSTAIREAVRHHDPDLPAVRVSSLEAKLATRQAKREFYLWTLSLFGGLAGVLAAVGIYGVMAHVVGLRAREVGIRLALGARPSQIKLLVVGQGLRPVMIGLAGGLVVAWWTTDLLRVNTVFASQLFHVTPHDPWTFAAACAGLLGVAVIACWIPARRTSRLDPAAVLKAE